MGALGWIALKDLLRLQRRRVDTFFVFLFPVVYAAFFTQVVSGSAAGASRIRLAVVVEDDGETARTLLERLQAEEGLKVSLLDRAAAEERVRRGRQAAYVVLPKGMDDAEKPELTLAIDPARQGEAGLLRGLLLRLGGELQAERLKAKLADAPRPPGVPAPTPPAFEPLRIAQAEVGRTREKAPVPAAVTLPQGAIWALLACAAAFGASLVGERTTGTLRRLRMAPIGILPVLLGKGLACFITILIVSTVLFAGVAPLFGVSIGSPPLLALAVAASGLCYVGLMLLIGSLGSSEDAAYRIGWALILVLAMVGGAMVPTYLMPGWMAALSHASPVRWTLLAFEGAVWRGFSLRDMLLPCGVLIGFGVACFTVGALVLRRRMQQGWGG